MSPISNDIATLLVRELEGFKRELDMFPDDESIWKTKSGVTNSAANLALHVAGGLQYLVGAVVGGSGYVRDREDEFGRRAGTRAEVAAELDKAIATTRRVLSHLEDETLQADFPEPILGVTVKTRAFLLHLCTHAALHLGQAGYLRRVVMEDWRTSGPIPIATLTKSEK